MICFWSIFILVSVLPKRSVGIRVSMQGSMRLGEGVMESLSFYVTHNQQHGRRSFGSDSSDDKHRSLDISSIVNSAALCRDINFCKGTRESLVNEYIILLAEAIELIFEDLVNGSEKKQNENTPKVILFEEDLKELIIPDIKELLMNLNENTKKHEVTFTWIDLIKRINAKFNEQAVKFAFQSIEGNAQEITEVIKKLNQEIVIATSTIELKFESILCSKHNVCSKSYECTKAMNTLLDQIKNLPDDFTKEFLKLFNEILPHTHFYEKISDVTGHELQSILSDMAYDDNILTIKNVISVLHKSVEARNISIISKFAAQDGVLGKDVRLVHIILSDMDHFYRNEKPEPFQEFFSNFFEWINNGGRFSTSLRSVMQNIQKMLSSKPGELVWKLANEVKVFLELTVDPSPNL